MVPGVRRRLRFKFVIVISFLVALVLVANTAVLVVSSRRQIRADIEQRGESFAALAVRPVCEAYETYYQSGYSKFRELVREVARLNPDVVRLVLYDTTGRVLFDSVDFEDPLFDPRRREPLTIRDEEKLEAIKGLSATTLADGDEGGQSAYEVIAPYIEEWGRHRYTVSFHLSYESLRSALQETGWRIAWLSGFSLLLGIVIAVVLSRQSLIPVEKLTSTARDLADGNLDRRLDLSTGDEFEVLARTFNQMAARLSSTIADLEATNVALHRSNEELMQLDRMKNELLANVSHELRTPVTAIKGYAEALDEGMLGPVNDEQLRAFRVIERNVLRLIGMINELLSYARLESGSIPLEPQSFDLPALAEELVTSIREARGPNLDLRYRVEGEISRVYGDPTRISQVLDNLLTNAIKFTPEGGAIELGIEQDREDEVEVKVSDTGIGIPVDEQSRIFDRFYQVDSSSTRSYGGIGLGLAIVRQILDAHGVDIHVEGARGEGSVFRFCLPVAPGSRRTEGTRTEGAG